RVLAKPAASVEQPCHRALVAYLRVGGGVQFPAVQLGHVLGPPQHPVGVMAGEVGADQVAGHLRGRLTVRAHRPRQARTELAEGVCAHLNGVAHRGYLSRDGPVFGFRANRGPSKGPLSGKWLLTPGPGLQTTQPIRLRSRSRMDAAFRLAPACASGTPSFRPRTSSDATACRSPRLSAPPSISRVTWPGRRDRGGGQGAPQPRGRSGPELLAPP